MKSVYQTSINIAAGCAIGYAQTGDVTTAPPGTLKSVELNGLPDLSEISAGRKNNYQYWARLCAQPGSSHRALPAKSKG
jgi:hypothetical protein